MPSHSIVQSVLLRRSAFRTLDEARKWITDHGYKYSMPDVTPTYYRFRQHAPEPLALTHRLRTTQLGESDKFSPMGSVGALIIAYPKSSRPMAKDPPEPESKKETHSKALKEWERKVKELEDEIARSMIGGTPKDRRALAERYRASSVKRGHRPTTFKMIDSMPVREIAHNIAVNELSHLFPGLFPR